MASHTIKITGITEEFLRLIDRRIEQEHLTGRAEYFRELARKDLRALSVNPPTIKPPEFPIGSKAWRDAFHKWLKSHKRDTPLLSDEAMRRENIYGHRG